MSVLLNSLSGMDHKLLIVLNKADQFEKIHDFARAYGSCKSFTSIWSVGRKLLIWKNWRNLLICSFTFIIVHETTTINVGLKCVSGMHAYYDLLRFKSSSSLQWIDLAWTFVYYFVWDRCRHLCTKLFYWSYPWIGWNLSKVIPRKDLPPIFTMSLKDEDSQASQLPASLSDLSANKDDVVELCMKAPKRRIDNVITNLYDSTSTLILFSKIWNDVS